jgi:hypothetical protein
MATKKETNPKATTTEIDILQINRGRVEFCILGTKGFISNRLSQKTRHELLMPKGRKSSAEKAINLKHDPLQEFRDSPYTDSNPDGPTVVQFLSSAFKKAMASAALDIPGAAKSQIGRLAWVEGDRVAMYGIPQLIMSPVRSADMNRTPDIRTRMIIPQWACRITVAFASPILNVKTITNLMAAAGMIRGVGDWRTEKGSDTFGSFELVEETNAQWKSIIKNGGRKAQLAAIANPDFYDDETAELYSWFETELANRGKSNLRTSNGVHHAETEEELALA